MTQDGPLESIRRRRREISQEIKRLKSEDNELETAERVILRLTSHAGDVPRTRLGQVFARAGEALVETEQSAKVLTTRQAILEYLYRTPDLWRTANHVRENVSGMKGAEVPMSTISPTLSELKKEGYIVRDGLKVALWERVAREQPDFFNENGEAEASPDTDQGASPDQDS